MRPIHTASLLAALVCALTVHAHAQSSPTRRIVSIGGVRDTGQFLPDDHVLIRVGDRTLDVLDFRDGFYATFAEVRPRPDSAGRVEFLRNMVRKEVLGLTANSLQRQLTFEDRANLREYQQRLLGNLLYTRAVADSLDLGDAAVARVYDHYGRDLRLRHLFFDDRTKAERVRGQLMRGQLTWAAAQTLYGRPDGKASSSSTPDWFKFESLPPDLGLAVWAHRVGEFPPVLVTPTGYHLVQVAEQRARKDRPDINALRTPIRNVLRGVQITRYREQVQVAAMDGMEIVIDSAVVRSAAARFTQTMKATNEGFGAQLDFDAHVPEFTDVEKQQVLARWKDGNQITLQKVLHSYEELPTIGRPSLNTPEGFIDFTLNVLLEPRLVELARIRGLEKDPTYIALMAKKEEEIRVIHMVEDTVFTRVQVTSADRRAHYEQNKQSFHSYPIARFAKLLARTPAEAESLRAVLSAASDIEAVVAAHQQQRGAEAAGMNEMRDNESGPDKAIVFEMLRPGQNTSFGPDRLGNYMVHHLVSRDEGRQLSFAEVESFIDDNLRTSRSEAGLEAFVERLKTRYRVEWHPELVMRIRLTDPAADAL